MKVDISDTVQSMLEWLEKQDKDKIFIRRLGGNEVTHGEFIDEINEGTPFAKEFLKNQIHQRIRFWALKQKLGK